MQLLSRVTSLAQCAGVRGLMTTVQKESGLRYVIVNSHYNVYYMKTMMKYRKIINAGMREVSIKCQSNEVRCVREWNTITISTD